MMKVSNDDFEFLANGQVSKVVPGVITVSSETVSLPEGEFHKVVLELDQTKHTGMARSHNIALAIALQNLADWCKKR
jgi:hypothetical protein